MARARIAQHVVEVLIPTDTFSPTTPTGAGISQAVVEVLGSFPGKARVSQYVVEVLISEDENQTTPGGGTSAATHAFGYAV